MLEGAAQRKTIKSGKCRKAKNSRKETQKKCAKLNLLEKKRSDAKS